MSQVNAWLIHGTCIAAQTSIFPLLSEFSFRYSVSCLALLYPVWNARFLFFYSIDVFIHQTPGLALGEKGIREWNKSYAFLSTYMKSFHRTMSAIRLFCILTFTGTKIVWQYSVQYMWQTSSWAWLACCSGLLKVTRILLWLYLLTSVWRTACPIHSLSANHAMAPCPS